MGMCSPQHTQGAPRGQARKVEGKAVHAATAAQGHWGQKEDVAPRAGFL